MADDNGLALLPGEVTLHGPKSSHRLLVQTVTNSDDAAGTESIVGAQVTEGLTFTSSDETVAVVRDGVVLPRGNGRATIAVAEGTRRATAEVRVVAFDESRPWNFRNDVLTVLTRKGCNSGACHGALAGKGGFKLSLRAYDPRGDYSAIARQAKGRRIELADPGKSLLLTKPSGAIPHKGGVRFDVGTLPYEILSGWIAEGAPPPDDSDARPVRIEVLPENFVAAPGQRQQMLVRAHYDDGRVEDVTPWAMFASADESVAAIDDHGAVTVRGRGEGAVTAWFASRIVIARVTAPYPHEIPDEVHEQQPRRNFIDELVLEKLRRLNLRPSPPATDAEFLRRAYVDTIGTLPTVEETRAFLADADPDKRDRLVEQLLNRPEFVDYWTYKWSDLLLINGTMLRPQAVKAYYGWIREQVEKNTPWDRFAREILTAKGSSVENGATNFYALHQDPEDMAENASQSFLGLSIGCAKCHNHPLEKWTNDQYYAMANLFSRVRAKGWGGDARSGDGRRTVFVVDSGDLIQPSTGKAQPPAPLDGEPVEPEAPGDRRVHLARWLTSPDNDYFARSITNRVWANFLGVGLVEPVDDMRASNPASNEQLLNAAARYLVEHDFDLKSLMRAILQSETYRRSATPLPENKEEKRFYSRYYPRRMMAEVILDAVSQVTDVPTLFDEILYLGADKQKTDFYPKGTRALQLYDSAVESYFLRTFGRNQRRITCECERSDEPTMVQVLHISNGDTINEKLSADGNRVDQLLKSGKSNREVIEEIYLMSLSRFPTEEESSRLMAVLEESGDVDRRTLIEDVFWAVLSSREFLFNH